MVVLQDNFFVFVTSDDTFLSSFVFFKKKCDINLTHIQKTAQNVQLNCVS